jgi:D-sedoheptulose 7-phosphate isomerase
LIMPSSVTARIQEAHIFVGHSLCEILESDWLNSWIKNYSTL